MSHEDFSRSADAAPGSERSFGLVLSAVLALIALSPLRHGEGVRLWALASSVGLGALALAAPSGLRTPNALWSKLGLALHRATSPIMMAVLFYGLLFPIALVFRLRGSDPLDLAFDRRARSYWRARSPSESGAGDMRRQF
jgi:hypothetical protein